MTASSLWQALADRLSAALHLNVAPIAITCASTGAVPFVSPTVPMLDRTFTTQPEDHGNCSVGSLTHGLIDLETAATRADVGTLVEAGWVTPEMFPLIPVVAERPDAITPAGRRRGAARRRARSYQREGSHDDRRRGS